MQTSLALESNNFLEKRRCDGQKEDKSPLFSLSKKPITQKKIMRRKYPYRPSHPKKKNIWQMAIGGFGLVSQSQVTIL